MNMKFWINLETGPSILIERGNEAQHRNFQLVFKGVALPSETNDVGWTSCPEDGS